MKTLITYFSAEGTTRKVAEELAELIQADLFEITPAEPYTKADIDWRTPDSRCNREFKENLDVPVSKKVDGFESYDTVLIGFPIWYGAAPNVVHTFCKEYDWNGKKVYAFATSGGGGLGKTVEKLMPYVSGAAVVDAKLVKKAEEVKSWLDTLG